MTAHYCLDGSVIYSALRPEPYERDEPPRGGPLRQPMHDPYNSVASPPASDTIEFIVPDTIEVVILSCETNL